MLISSRVMDKHSFEGQSIRERARRGLLQDTELRGSDREASLFYRADLYQEAAPLGVGVFSAGGARRRSEQPGQRTKF